MDLHYSIGEALGTDYFGLREPFTAQQESYLVRTREFVDAEVLPVINGYWERAEFPWALIEKMAALGIVGDGIEGYGCPPMDPLSAGLIHMEINRGDGSLGTFLGGAGRAGDAVDREVRVRGAEAALAAGPMARLEKIGAFALTEPSTARTRSRWRPRPAATGSPTSSTAHKKWIGNGSIADVVVRVGAGHLGQRGQGVPGREGHPRLRRQGHGGQGIAARGLAGGDRARRRARPRGEPAAGRELVQGLRRSADRRPAAPARGRPWATRSRVSTPR